MMIAKMTNAKHLTSNRIYININIVPHVYCPHPTPPPIIPIYISLHLPLAPLEVTVEAADERRHGLIG